MSASRRARKATIQAHFASGTYKPRRAVESTGSSNSLTSSTPRLLREAYSLRPAGDPTIASYCSATHCDDLSVGRAT